MAENTSHSEEFLRRGFTTYVVQHGSPAAQAIKGWRDTALDCAPKANTPSFEQARRLYGSITANSVDYTSGYMLYDADNHHNGRVNVVVRRALDALKGTQSDAGSAATDGLVERSLDLLDAVGKITDELLKSVGESYRSAKNTSLPANIGEVLPEYAQADRTSPSGITSVTTQWYPKSANRIEAHVDCTMLTIVLPGAGDTRLELLDRSAGPGGVWVAPAAKVKPAQGEPIVVFAGFLLDVILQGLDSTMRAEYTGEGLMVRHRVLASADGQPRLSAVIRCRPSDGAHLNPSHASNIAAGASFSSAPSSSLPTAANEQPETVHFDHTIPPSLPCKRVVELFRTTHDSVNFHRPYKGPAQDRAAAGGRSAGASASGAASGNRSHPASGAAAAGAAGPVSALAGPVIDLTGDLDSFSAEASRTIGAKYKGEGST